MGVIDSRTFYPEQRDLSPAFSRRRWTPPGRKTCANVVVGDALVNSGLEFREPDLTRIEERKN
jgi:hypothetical protein